jgi:hypothetical protein
MIKPSIVAVVLILMSLSAIPTMQVCAQGNPVDLKFLTIAKSSDDGPTTPQFRIITTRKGWAAAWRDCTSNDPLHPRRAPAEPPEVDFSKEIVVIVAAGRSLGTNAAVTITRLAQTEEGLVVHYQVTPGQVGTADDYSQSIHIARAGADGASLAKGIRFVRESK